MVSFGIMLRPGQFPFSHLIACMKTTQAMAFDHLWFGDSHVIWHEVGAYLTAATMSTTRMRVGPLVANPVTRHPTVVASAIATLAELSDGRVVLGLGRGDSAVRRMGLAPMKLAEFRDAFRLVRRLCRGAACELDGTSIRFAWLTRTVPVLLAAYGPRVLALAAEADGVVLQLASPDAVAWATRHVRESARAARRTLEGFKVPDP